MAVPLQAVLSYLMHIDIGVFEADGGVTYTGDGVVEERVSLLEGFEILCRKGFVHVDFRGSRIGWRQPRSSLALSIDLVLFLWVLIMILFKSGEFLVLVVGR